MNNVDLSNDKYQDEINENDIIIQEPEKKKIWPVLLIILFILLLAGLLLFGLYKKGFVVINNSYYTGDDLFIVHSKPSFGEKISFSNYTSYNNAYSYSFSVNNNTEYDSYYNIVLIDKDFNKFNNISNINYSIERNFEVLYKGNLKNVEENILVNQKIISGDSANYVLKLWTDKNVDNILNFKIVISN